MIRNFIYFVVSFLLFTTISNAQPFQGPKPEKKVPNIVQAAFNSKFADADVVWFTHYEGRYSDQLVYEGRFMFDNRYSTAIYDRDGDLLAFVVNVDYKELPELARQYMKDNFPTRPFIDALLVTEGKNEVTYEIGIIMDGEYVVKVFSKKGEFIKSDRP